MMDVKTLDGEEDFQALITDLQRRGWFNGPDGDLRRDQLDTACKDRAEHKHAIAMLYENQQRKNELSRIFGARKKNGESTDDLTADIHNAERDVAFYQHHVKDLEARYMAVLATVPNRLHDFVPDGASAEDNVLCHDGSQEPPRKPEFDFPIRDHVEIGTRMGCMDFEQTARVSGSRFVTLTGALAKLERVLGQWALDEITSGFGNFEEVSPPHLVKRDAMFGTGQLPKFEEDLFRTSENRYLIPTAEVSLTNLARDVIYEKGESSTFRLMAALTPCYRAEAGSAGRERAV